IDDMANHGNRIRDYMDRYGVEEVENFIDACLSIEDLIDIFSPHIKRRDDQVRYDIHDDSEEEHEGPTATRFQAKSYMDSYVNPKKAMDAELEEKKKELERKENFPAEPARDVM